MSTHGVLAAGMAVRTSSQRCQPHEPWSSSLQLAHAVHSFSAAKQVQIPAAFVAAVGKALPLLVSTSAAHDLYESVLVHLARVVTSHARRRLAGVIAAVAEATKAGGSVSGEAVSFGTKRGMAPHFK